MDGRNKNVKRKRIHGRRKEQTKKEDTEEGKEEREGMKGKTRKDGRKEGNRGHGEKSNKAKWKPEERHEGREEQTWKVEHGEEK